MVKKRVCRKIISWSLSTPSSTKQDRLSACSHRIIIRLEHVSCIDHRFVIDPSLLGKGGSLQPAETTA